MTPAPQVYVQRNGFRETLMVRDGEDEREATDDECHAEWVASRSQYDARAQAADDLWGERA
jgi:hypothetical protein